MKTLRLSLLLCATALVCAAQNPGMQPKMENPADMKFINIPNVPTCLTASIERGDPFKEPFTIFVRGTAGCDVPLHFHSAAEQVMMVGGTGRMLMKGEKPRILRAGGFALAPARHAHHFTCVTACQFYLSGDGAFDIHYIDAGGKEIPFEQAVPAAGRAPASH
ncbi:MAG: hypothetical protein LAN36_13985 [Acidobacteriia bacterium]|nr:hypothetical protein [Terriglobia bacterium]